MRAPLSEPALQTAVKRKSGVARVRSEIGPIARYLWCNRVHYILPLLATLALTVDVFGFGAATQRQSEEIAVRLLSGWYSAPAQNKVTAVIVDGEFAKTDPVTGEQTHGWPMPYVRYADLIRQLLPLKPAAIYLDVLFASNRPDSLDSIKPLFAALVEAKAERIPIFLAERARIRSGSAEESSQALCASDKQIPDLESDTTSVREDLRKHVRDSQGAVQFAATNWFGCSGRYPLFAGGNSQLASPAQLLATSYCSRGASGCAESASIPAQSQHPMLIRWGAFLSQQQWDLAHRAPCSKRQNPDHEAWFTAALMLGDLLTSLSQALDSGSSRGPRLRCHYVNEIVATAVMTNRSAVEDLIRERVVLVGPGPETLPTWQPNPVNDRVPLVIVHAAATENLIGLGRRYARSLDDRFIPAIQFISVIVASSFLLWRRRYCASRTSGDIPAWRRDIAVGLVIISIGVVCLSIGGGYEAVVLASLLSIAWLMYRPAALLLTAVCVIAGLAITAVFLESGKAPADWIGILLASSLSALELDHEVVGEKHG